MRGVRIRELLLVVVLVALGLAWWLDHRRLAERVEHYRLGEVESGAEADRLAVALAEAEATAEVEIAHREQAEIALAACEGR